MTTSHRKTLEKYAAGDLPLNRAIRAVLRAIGTPDPRPARNSRTTFLPAVGQRVRRNDDGKEGEVTMARASFNATEPARAMVHIRFDDRTVDTMCAWQVAAVGDDPTYITIEEPA